MELFSCVWSLVIWLLPLASLENTGDFHTPQAPSALVDTLSLQSVTKVLPTAEEEQSTVYIIEPTLGEANGRSPDLLIAAISEGLQVAAASTFLPTEAKVDSEKDGTSKEEPVLLQEEPLVKESNLPDVIEEKPRKLLSSIEEELAVEDLNVVAKTSPPVAETIDLVAETSDSRNGVNDDSDPETQNPFAATPDPVVETLVSAFNPVPEDLNAAAVAAAVAAAADAVYLDPADETSYAVNETLTSTPGALTPEQILNQIPEASAPSTHSVTPPAEAAPLEPTPEALSLPAVEAPVVEASNVDTQTETVATEVGNSSTHASNETSLNEDDLPSFSDWTQKQLAVENKSGSSGNANGTLGGAKTGAAHKLRQKNYASPDCGSKIIATNPESKHASAVLLESRDEYLLSPCAPTKTWFVVELCEAIRTEKVEIANFELYSSSMRNFRVMISDRFPTRDWTLLGNLTAVDERSVQSFALQNNDQFGKFVKVEVDTHYGKQHFCPISLFRVYGTSEYEVLDSDERRDAHDAEDEDDDEADANALDADNAVREDPASASGADADPRREPSNLSSIKDAVYTIVKNVVGGLVSRDDVGSTAPVADDNATLAPTVADGVVSTPSAPEAPPPPTTTTTTSEAPPTAEPASGLCHSAAVQVAVDEALDELSCQWELLNVLASLPWLRFDAGQACLGTLSAEIRFAQAVWGASNVLALCYWVRMEPRPASIDDVGARTADAGAAAASASGQETGHEPPSLAEAAVADAEPVDFFEPIDLEHVSILEPALGEGEGSDSGEEVAVAAGGGSGGGGGGGGSGGGGGGGVGEGPKADAEVAKGRSVSNGAQQKESVFLRLSNRIKVLERNMTLSSQYLEELSRRYRRQMDELQKNHNRTVKALNETLQLVIEDNKLLRLENSAFLAKLAHLESRVNVMHEESQRLENQMVARHFYLMVAQLAVLAALWRWRHRTADPPRASSQRVARARRSSHVEPTSAACPSSPSRTMTPHSDKASDHFYVNDDDEDDMDGEDDDDDVDFEEGDDDELNGRPRSAQSYCLEASPKVEVLEARRRLRSLPPLSFNDPADSASHRSSVADSCSSSGCESAFNYPAAAGDESSAAPSTAASSVDLHLAVCNGVEADAGDEVDGRAKATKKRRLSRGGEPDNGRSGPPTSGKIRLKSDNWEWHCRVKTLAAAFIQENYNAIGICETI